MKTFKYTAITASGVNVDGLLQAKSENDALIQLRESYSTVTGIREVRENAGLSSFAEKLTTGKVTDKALSLLCRQFSIIFSAGMPIVRTVELVAGQTQDKTLKKILEEVVTDVESGKGLADSFADRGKKLPATFIETIRAGEESGSLSTSMSRLSSFYEKKASVSGKVVSALTYPAFVLVVAVAVVAVIMIKAVPVFSSTFEELGVELPMATKLLIGASNFLTKYILIILAILAVIVLGIRAYGSTASGKLTLARLKLNIPILGKIQRMNSSSQFANTLSTMLASGLQARRALSITASAMSNAYIGDAIENVVSEVESGYTIGASLKKAGVLPDLLVEMTAVGEESGSLESTLDVVGEYYNSEVDTATTRATSLIEPMIIVFLAVFVVFVLLAVYMPMFSMYSTM